MKGIILAGGNGTRLSPLTKIVNKQSLPVYNKPMLFYPLQTLIDMGIKNVLIICISVSQIESYYNIFRNGDGLGIDIRYQLQDTPGGIPEAFIIGEQFIGDDDVTLILGDNVFIQHSIKAPEPNTIFTYKVRDPGSYGVVQIENDRPVDVIEKPETYIGSDAIVGLYTFKNDCIEIAKELKPSNRDELEIVDIIRHYLNRGELNVQELDGYWFDCGSFDDLLECSNLVKAIETRTGKSVGFKL